MDLNLLTWLCGRVDVDALFASAAGPGMGPLSQPVLMSLVQQLSTELATATTLKLKSVPRVRDAHHPLQNRHAVSLLANVWGGAVTGQAIKPVTVCTVKIGRIWT